MGREEVGVAVRAIGPRLERVLDSTRPMARAARVQLAETLRAVASGDRSLLARIDEAANQTNNTEGLPGALASLVAIGRSMLVKPSPAMKVRLGDGEAGLTEEWLDDCEDLVRGLRSAGIMADSPLPQPAVTQAEVDRWDGINLVLLRRVIRLFDAAHAVDNTVPRLMPIALRTFWHKRTPKEVTEPAPGPQPPVPNN